MVKMSSHPLSEHACITLLDCSRWQVWYCNFGFTELHGSPLSCFADGVEQLGADLASVSHNHGSGCMRCTLWFAKTNITCWRCRISWKISCLSKLTCDHFCPHLSPHIFHASSDNSLCPYGRRIGRLPPVKVGHLNRNLTHLALRRIISFPSHLAVILRRPIWDLNRPHISSETLIYSLTHTAFTLLLPLRLICH